MKPKTAKPKMASVLEEGSMVMKDSPSGDRPRRIGLMLASIHTGTSNDLWPELARTASADGAAFFVFPVGRLKWPTEGEYLRNDLISLVNRRNIDGLISWASSLGGHVPLTELSDVHDAFDIPYVTIGMKKTGHPNVEFDAYTGVRSAVMHCIKVHGAQRIAFIRGPESHVSAQDRYRAYLDALALAGIGLDPALVSPPFAWSRGGDALDVLAGERALVPGKDFDALVCASDLLLYGAGRRLESMGVRIPQDLILIGFNDSQESRLLQVPCTTVRMPISDLGMAAWNAIMRQISEVTGASQDIMLPVDLVLRHSCGCEAADVFGPAGRGGERQPLMKRIGELFSLSEAGKRKLEIVWDAIEKAALLDDKEGGKEADMSAFRGFGEFLYSLISSGAAGAGTGLLYEALDRLCLGSPDIPRVRRYVEKRLYPLVSQVQDRIHNQHTYELGQTARHLNALKVDLLRVRSLSVIPQLLASHLPALGITGAYLVLSDDAGYPRLSGGYDASGLIGQGHAFSREDLLPREIMERLGAGVYVVEALHVDRQSLGYLVIRTTAWDGSLLEELRASLSSAINGALLVDDANRAREKAEQAERIRTEFLASVGDGLKEPLEGIRKIVQESGTASSPAGIGILNHISRAGYLMDLAMSRTGSMEMERRLINPGIWLTETCGRLGYGLTAPERTPMILADVRRLSQVCEIIGTEIIADGHGCMLSCAVHRSGLAISLASDSGGWRARVFENSPGLALAERIILLHGGEFSIGENSVSLNLPWPTLSGASPTSSSGTAVVLGPCPENGGYPPWADIHVIDASNVSSGNLLSVDAGLLIWDASDAVPASFSALRRLGEEPRFSALGFMAYGLASGGQSLMESVESLSGDMSVGSVFLYGDVPTELRQVFQHLETIILSSPSDFVSRAPMKPPLILLSDRLAAYDAEVIRRQVIGGDVPILLYKSVIDEAVVKAFGEMPGLIFCDDVLARCEAFHVRLKAAMSGAAPILPALTGIIVKRAMAYLQAHAAEHVSRWQVAEAVNVSEDYLTRIFRRETGLSPWDYLIRCRISRAVRLLRTSGMTISEVAFRTGFQDQAYFCRVFKKIMGDPPGRMRGH
ncbi:helix-turn-helix domain-containing protein [Parasphaerochaeta coccoides]|nr:helix-turn-helix domain-containing protein [Parasphaerochaeta coccoides]